MARCLETKICLLNEQKSFSGRKMEILTFEKLFSEYANHYSNPHLTENQQKRLKNLHELNRKTNTTISLSQSDSWMIQAGLINNERLTIMDTGTTFFTFE